MGRSFHKRIASFALLAWITVAVGPVMIPHGEVFDLACSDDAWRSHHDTTQIEGVLPSVADEHCVVCHLQRMARGAVAERVRALVAPDTNLARTFASDSGTIVRHTRALPARAPPSASL